MAGQSETAGEGGEKGARLRSKEGEGERGPGQAFEMQGERPRSRGERPVEAQGERLRSEEGGSGRGRLRRSQEVRQAVSTLGTWHRPRRSSARFSQPQAAPAARTYLGGLCSTTWHPDDDTTWHPDAEETGARRRTVDARTARPGPRRREGAPERDKGGRPRSPCRRQPVRRLPEPRRDGAVPAPPLRPPGLAAARRGPQVSAGTGAVSPT